ncbi:MAG: RluA family pseudouridine synthase [Clostridia bacterium]|nr:RluA family pseudouridine synthase [Clostridia bacterium]
MIEILFENSELVACVKPVGVASQNDKATDMVKLLEKQMNSNVFPIHRLDTAVGGTMVFAKTPKAAAELSKIVSEGQLRKRYLAVISGKPDKDSDVLEDLLFKDSSKNKSFVVKRERKGVRKAKLEYEVLGFCDGMSLLRILLHTGRSHQIRVQFSSRKMPLVGDGKYGSRDNRCNVALWSEDISFKWNSDEMTFMSKPDKTQFPWSLFENI